MGAERGQGRPCCRTCTCSKPWAAWGDGASGPRLLLLRQLLLLLPGLAARGGGHPGKGAVGGAR